MTLDHAPLGAPLTLAQVDADRALVRRLSALGMRVGTPLRVVRRTSGGGRIVAVGGARVALGREMAARVEVETR